MSESPRPVSPLSKEDPVKVFVESFTRERRPERALAASVLDFRGSATDEQLRNFVSSWLKAFEELDENPDDLDSKNLPPRVFLSTYHRPVIGLLKQARGCLVSNKSAPRYIMKTINLLNHGHIGSAGQLAFLDEFFRNLYKHFALHKSHESTLENTVSTLAQEVRRLGDSNAELTQKLATMMRKKLDETREVRTLRDQNAAQALKLAELHQNIIEVKRALHSNTHRERCELASPNGSSRANKRNREENIRSSLDDQ